MTLKSIIGEALGFAKTETITMEKFLEQEAEKLKKAEPVVETVNTLKEAIAAVETNPMPTTTLGALAKTLVTNSQRNLQTVKSLETQIAGLNEELRQRNAAQSAIIGALTAIASDTALTADERNAVNVEIQAQVDRTMVAAAALNPADIA